MGVVLAVTAAFLWGIADYAGAIASRRTTAIMAAACYNAASAAVAASWVLLSGQDFPAAGLVGWAIVAGFGSAGGMMLFFYAFTTGKTAIVAPTVAVVAAVLPVIVGLLTERAPSPVALGAIGLALAAITLVSMSDHGESNTSSNNIAVAAAVVAGILFGGMFIAIKWASPGGATAWPTFLFTATAAVVSTSTWLFTRKPGERVNRDLLTWGAPAGAMAGLAAAVYVTATGKGALALIVPMASLYPAVTILLALARDGEKVVMRQGIGLACAGLALVMAGVS